MCGLFGIASPTSSFICLEHARKALDLQTHRGPDGEGQWHNPYVYMGHRRLSILDLSESGSQPMLGTQCVISVNGEIYNYRQLRKELEKTAQFKSQSDSEVVLHGYEKWGLEALAKKLEGMYAIVIYDLKSNQVHLIRDRIGIKPLYYAYTKNGLLWSSELKSIAHYLELGETHIDKTALLDFLTYRYIPSPKTLYQNVYKLPAAHTASYDIEKTSISKTHYWQLPLSTEESTSDYELVEQLSALLDDSIEAQLVSDVPVGAFLSGGIDSALLVAKSLAQGHPLPTFSIGFYDQQYDESDRIDLTTQHLGLKNHLRTLSMEDTTTLFSSMRSWFDEPFADYSALPTYSVCEHTRQSATVALSGDGADELFAGYPRYLEASKRMKYSESWKPSKSLGGLKRYFGWRIAGRLIREAEFRYKLSMWDWYCVATGGLLPNETQYFAQALGIEPGYDRYWLYRQHYHPKTSAGMALRRMEMQTALPDLLLTKVDRVSMQNALEVRVPYLSTRLVEFAFRLSEQQLFKQRS